MRNIVIPLKHIKISIFMFHFLWASLYELPAQETHIYQLEDLFEQLAIDDDEGEHNWENELEELSERIREPLNLNSITKEQLEQFPFLTDIQIENLLAYIYVHGQMKTVYELQLVAEMDWQTIAYLLPFVCADPVGEPSSLPPIGKILNYGKNEILARLDLPFYMRRGYYTSYLGPSIYHSLRYSFRYKDRIYGGVTAEKDAGEPMFALHNTNGYDYYSFYFYMRDIGKLKALAVGNYRLSFGQGLVISNDFTLGKTTAVSTLASRNNGIKKHSSTDEYNYFRGVAGTVKLDRILLSAFYSNRLLDGIADENAITSVHKTGLHRTAVEANRKSVFTQQLMGSNLTYSKNKLKLGLTGIYYFFDRPYEPTLREYSKYNIRGNNFYNVGVDYRYRWRRFTFAGETAFGKSGGAATLNTVRYSPLAGYHLIFVQRYYARNYWGFFSRSFSEGGYVQNENGYYLAVEAAPISHWKFFLSADYFTFPWLKYGIDKPSSGFDGTVQTTYTPNSTLTMSLRYRYKKKEKNYTENKVKTVRPLYQHRVRYQLSYSPFSNVTLRSVFDYNRINPQGVAASQGYQFVQRASYAFRSIPLKIEASAAWFHTDDYSSRVYSSEKGLLYTFYSPSFYGRGTRLVAYARCDFSRSWMLIAKYGRTAYTDRDEIGSGLDLIKGNTKSDLQMQLRVKF